MPKWYHNESISTHPPSEEENVREQIRSKVAAFRQGYDAYMSSKNRSSSPFKPGSANDIAWNQGYEIAKQLNNTGGAM